MTPPKTTIGGGDIPQTTTTTTDTATTEGNTGPEIRRIPAHVGTIGSTETAPGTPAQAGQPGTVTPASSTLVGDGTDGYPAASAKSAQPATSGIPKTSGPAVTPGTDAPPAKPADRPVPAAPRRGGFWPMVFGGAVAAGLGAAATLYALPRLPAAWLPQTEQTGAQAVINAPAIDEAALMQSAADAGRQAAEQVVAQMPQAAPAQAAPAQAALPDEVLARIDALEQQSAAPGALGQGSSAAQPDQLAALQQRLDDQQARLDQLEQRPAFDPQATEQARQQIQTTAAEVQDSLNAARTEAQELQTAAEDSTRRAQAVAAIAGLQTALDAGVTPDQARSALEGAGLDTPQALQAQIPSLTSLQSGFAEAARAALRTSLREAAAQGQGNVLTNFLRAQTGARSTQPRDGDDPDAVLSRADAEVQAGRIDPALALIQTLPEPARAAPAMAGWLAGATAYSQAQAALTDLSSGTN